MNDLISRQAALIESLESALLKHKDGSFILCSPEFVSVAVEILKELKTLQWIPCSEGLPKAGEYIGDVARYYLVQNEYGDMLVARYTHSEYWEQIYQSKPYADEIVAWMPLPEPYKGEES